MPIRIILIDDHQILRQGLRALLERESDFRVIGEAQDGRTGVQIALDNAPDVVIMDIGMPELNGIDATRQIIARQANIKVIALSMHAERGVVQEMLMAGASGYLLKESAYDELVHAIRLVLADQVYLSQKIASLVVKDYLQRISQHDLRKSAQLSMREREVWQLLAEGHSSQAIADRLDISVRTVESHRQRLMEKLETKNIAEVIKLAIREGITSLDN